MHRKPVLWIAVMALTLLATGCGGGEEATSEPQRPAEPASPDAFRADAVEFVAATGRPQLVEFFAYW